MSLQKILAVAVGFSLAGCGPKVASIDVSPKTLTLATKGATAKLTATPKDAESKPVDGIALTFTSSDPTVASVDASGTVKAEKSGDAKISVAFEDKVKVETPVKVSIPATISVTPADVKLDPGGKQRVAVKVLDEKNREVTMAVTWENANPEIATVLNGEITAVSAGTAKLMAVATPTIKSPVTVTVTAPVVGSIEAPKTMDVVAGDAPAKIAFVTKDPDGKPVTGAALVFKSSNEKIVTVSPAGEVTGVAKGKAKIEITAGEKKATTEVNVKPGVPGAKPAPGTKPGAAPAPGAKPGAAAPGTPAPKPGFHVPAKKK